MLNTAIFIGTALQQKIFRALQQEIEKNTFLCQPLAVLLEDYYKLGLNLDSYNSKIKLKCLIVKPWYNQSPILKLISLLPFIFQVCYLSRKYQTFVFFVDTGILERTAIKVLNGLGRRTIVIQDALKRIPKNKKKKALTWFGSGNASYYFVTGSRYASMITNKRVQIIGSPIYDNAVKTASLGEKILIINQCFARYGEMTLRDELEFMAQVVKKAAFYGPVELRLHPHNDLLVYKHLESNDIEVSQSKPLFHSLKEAGVVMGVNSTVLLEAMILKRPVIILDWHPSPFENPITVGVIRCKNISDMCGELKKWKNKEQVTKNSELERKMEIRSHIAYSGKESIDKIIGALSRY